MTKFHIFSLRPYITTVTYFTCWNIFKKQDRNLTGRPLFLHDCHKRPLSKPFTHISIFKNPGMALDSQFPDPIVEHLHFVTPWLSSLKELVRHCRQSQALVHSREPRDNMKETKTNQQTFRDSKYQKRLFRDSPSVAVSKTWGTVSNTEENNS